MLLTMDDNMKVSYNKLITQLVKASVLGSVAVFSTWMFLFVGMMLIPNIGWFVTIDATINGITIYLMFNFAENTYLFLCKPFAVLCYLCFGGCHVAKQATKDKRFLATQISIPNNSPDPSAVTASGIDFAGAAAAAGHMHSPPRPATSIRTDPGTAVTVSAKFTSASINTTPMQSDESESI